MISFTKFLRSRSDLVIVAVVFSALMALEKIAQPDTAADDWLLMTDC
jgi:hypothetical protein